MLYLSIGSSLVFDFGAFPHRRNNIVLDAIHERVVGNLTVVEPARMEFLAPIAQAEFFVSPLQVVPHTDKGQVGILPVIVLIPDIGHDVS